MCLGKRILPWITFFTTNDALLSVELIDEYLSETYEEITNQVDQLTARGSGWIHDKVS